MATLVLTTIGGAVGGPIGAMLGAAIGQRVDRDVLFKPKGRQGPRLTELAIQTSSYGTAIPMLFGRLRVAGSVIWSTDLIERSGRSGGGKGQPTTTTYSYTASFAVALSARAILGVARVWADGKLLRGAAGDLKAAGRFRVHLGGEDQAVDPLIAALEGDAPAHRGIAYAVFEDLALGDFGNRIPSLTFEVIADDGAVTIGAIASAVAGDALSGAGPAHLLDGFSAYGDSVRGVVETLAEAAGAWFAPAGARMTMVDAGAPVMAIAAEIAAETRASAPLDTVPRGLSIAYYDPARDWQAGVQAVRRAGPGRREDRVDLPAALSADAARTMAARRLNDAEARRVRRTFKLSDATTVPPGAVVRVGDEAALWRVRSVTLEADGVLVDLDALAGAVAAMPGVAGRVATAADLVAGATILRAFEMPAMEAAGEAAGEAGARDRPQIMVVAGSAAPGWRRAALSYSLDAGASWSDLGGTAAAGVLGTTRSAMTAGQAMLIDRVGSVEVELAHGDMMLNHADAAMLDRGANLALIDGELLQFGRAERIGAAAWRLSVLWRGRRGTAAAMHDAGAAFTLIDAATVRVVPLPASMLGARVDLIAAGIADGPGGVRARIVIEGISMLPLAPVHLRIVSGGADRRVAWVRRSRQGWAWTDGGDVPLGEETERYRVTMPDGAQVVVTEPSVAVPNAAGMVAVRQIGTHGESLPATIII